MQDKLRHLRGSVSTKVFFIGFLVLILLIPVSMIKDVIDDRQTVSRQAEDDIMRSWGYEQLVAAPILVLPYEYMEVTQYGNRLVTGGRLYVLPTDLKIDVELRPEIRYRGIHKIPVYSSSIRFVGIFSKPDVNALKINAIQIDWDNSLFAIGVSDARAVGKTPQVRIGGQTSNFVAGGQQSDGLPPQIVAPITNPFNADDGQQTSFEFELNLSGSNSLRFLPLGDTTSVAMTSTWTSPSFTGSYLPVTREITDDGFSANWEISSLGRSIPSVWVAGELDDDEAHRSEFGVDIFMPVGIYQLTLRTTKYAVLFIGLTFVAYFLFEIMAGLQLHLLQYLLIGMANSLFYLLLLSLAEHTGFGWAYLASAFASSALIIGYSISVLELPGRAALMTVVLMLLYSFLYMMLTAESYALLVGSIGLWVSLAIVMFLTRKIDWYDLVNLDRPASSES